jgi:hypothetical protein
MYVFFYDALLSLNPDYDSVIHGVIGSVFELISTLRGGPADYPRAWGPVRIFVGTNAEIDCDLLHTY